MRGRERDINEKEGRVNEKIVGGKDKEEQGKGVGR